MTGRWGRRCRNLLDDLKEGRGYSHLNEEALDRTMWTACFGRGFGPVVRQTAKWTNSKLCLLQLSKERWKEKSEKTRLKRSLQCVKTTWTTATTSTGFCNTFYFREHFSNKLHSCVVSLTFLMPMSKAKLKTTFASAATKLLHIFAIFIHIFPWHTVLTLFCKQQAGYHEH